MRKLTSLSFITAAALCFALGASAADEPKSAADAPKLVCPVSGKEASKDHAAKYKKGEVYFCCDNCPAAFAKNTKKYATKANAQLVSTGQYKQKACPLTGKPVNKETATDIAGVSVSFCCNNCKGAIDKLDSDGDKLAKVFSDAAFKKGFKSATAKEKKKD